MTTTTTDFNDAIEDVFAWRLEQLVRVGLDPDLADICSRSMHIDVHDLARMVASGCPPRLAAEILR